ncbi:invasion associated locus B family protein [Wenxinia saemankumensis]|uniref:Invasion protein IalB, involved in pathogenesis n=1 Tax=Wenxinia saemankumensis TaxID=1447782 RepID=A0A1M6HCZ4_9RHOB|nr:invasion associated locus B family protein [Wenxinia saemankumensis]SHJ20050.1 Invasion protein IalB, involved in pathogenesis [Wenxinia saemankumensis]
MLKTLTLTSTLALATLAGAAWAQETDETTETPAETGTQDTAGEDAGTEDAGTQDAGTAETGAQDTGTENTGTAPSAAEDLSMGVPDSNQPGAPYTRAEYGDWLQRCLRVEEGPEPCTIYQLLEDEEGNPVAEVGLFPVTEGEAAAGANIVAPMETLLPAGLRISIDGSEPRTYPFTFCSARGFSPLLSSGCLARIGFDQATVDQMKRGARATVTIVPALAPDQTVALNMSLTGFTAAFEAGNEAVPAPAE